MRERAESEFPSFLLFRNYNKRDDLLWLLLITLSVAVSEAAQFMFDRSRNDPLSNFVSPLNHPIVETNEDEDDYYEEATPSLSDSSAGLQQTLSALDRGQWIHLQSTSSTSSEEIGPLFILSLIRNIYIAPGYMGSWHINLWRSFNKMADEDESYKGV